MTLIVKTVEEAEKVMKGFNLELIESILDLESTRIREVKYFKRANEPVSSVTVTVVDNELGCYFEVTILYSDMMVTKEVTALLTFDHMKKREKEVRLSYIMLEKGTKIVGRFKKYLAESNTND